jgi:protein TonB
MLTVAPWQYGQSGPAAELAAARRPVARSSRRGASVIAIALSSAAHAALLYAVLARPSSETGFVAAPTEAISVEVQATQVLEAIDAERLSEAQPSSAATPEGEIPQVKVIEPETTAVRAVEPETVSTREPDDAEAASSDLSPIAGAARTDDSVPKRSERPSASRRTEQPSRNAVDPDTSARPKPTVQKRKPASEKNASAGARAVQGSSGARAKVSASHGDVAGYAAKIRARVASRRPGGNGARGTVVISFAVSGSGSLASARISSSSGNRPLDSAALQAVRGAGPFPPPPGGAGLSFSVPFHYR